MVDRSNQREEHENHMLVYVFFYVGQRGLSLNFKFLNIKQTIIMISHVSKWHFRPHFAVAHTVHQTNVS